ncbi:hypothetical protein NE237_009658 [Protea cynaroides]|uniref:Uncharacterized protein n=1 Tax=Protea cynaroides TaxID=273540 RepID=A0A9Q0KXV7_9MAGN|nr:hypothetical protein NE237_009658 [Protea cynaroides]
MAESSNYPPMSNTVTVVGPHFCSPYPVDLTIVSEGLSVRDNFAVTDVKGNIVFKVKGSLFNIRDRHILLDANGNPVLSMQQKIMSAHMRWEVFRGESSDSKDLLFSTKKPTIFQMKTKLDAFLAANTKEEVCDFKIKGSWSERSCTIYLGESSNVIAQMHKKQQWFKKDRFMVTVYPNIDYAFIVALIVILNDINKRKQTVMATETLTATPFVATG